MLNGKRGNLIFLRQGTFWFDAFMPKTHTMVVRWEETGVNKTIKEKI